LGFSSFSGIVKTESQEIFAEKFRKLRGTKSAFQESAFLKKATKFLKIRRIPEKYS